MTVKTAWHEGLVLVDDDDPFQARIEDVGTPIALGAQGEEASLRRQLLNSVSAEAALDQAGVRCQIKDARDTSCHACPLFLADESPMAELCAIGRLQERLCTKLSVLAHGGRR